MSTKINEVVRDAVSESEIVELERNLIRIPSQTRQEKPLAEFILRFLRSQDIEADLQPVPIPEFELTESEAVPAVGHNVVAVLSGSGQGPSLMFSGHMDSGPLDMPVAGTAADRFKGWKRNPYDAVLENGRVYGKGAVDEKGGICGLLSTAVAIKRAALRPKGDIYFCPVMGHKTHNIGIKHLVKQGLHTKYGICTENSGSWIVPAHVGSLDIEVHVRGVNPVTRYSLPETMGKATGFVNAMRFAQALGVEGARQPDDGWLTFTPHSVLREFPDHRVSEMKVRGLDHIVVGLRVKTVPGMSDVTVKADLERVLNVLARQYPDFRAGDVVVRAGPPPLDTSFQSPVVKALTVAYSAVTGEEPRVGIQGRMGGIADSGVMADAGIETCIFGPGLMHDQEMIRGEVPPDEYVSVAELVNAARTMTLAAVDLCC